MCVNGCNNVQHWNTKHAPKQSLHFVICHSTWGKAMHTLFAKNKMEKNVPHLQNAMNLTGKKNWIVCVWEAQLVKVVSLNLTQSFQRVISFLSYFLHVSTET